MIQIILLDKPEKVAIKIAGNSFTLNALHSQTGKNVILVFYLYTV
jgi:hypothetical protein